MKSLNQAVYGPENEPTGQPIQEKVNSPEKLQGQIEKLEAKIAEAGAGRGKFANNEKKIAEWQDFLDKTRRDLANLEASNPKEASENSNDLNQAQSELDPIDKLINTQAKERDAIPSVDSIKKLGDKPTRPKKLSALLKSKNKLKKIQQALFQLRLKAQAYEDQEAEEIIQDRLTITRETLDGVEASIRFRLKKTKPVEVEVVGVIPKGETTKQRQNRRVKLESRIEQLNTKIKQLKTEHAGATKGDSPNITDLVLERGKIQDELDLLNTKSKKDKENTSGTIKPAETNKSEKPLKKSPEVLERERKNAQDSLLEAIKDSHAPYGKTLEDLYGVIGVSNKPIESFFIKNAEAELQDLLDLVNHYGIKRLLKPEKGTGRSYVRPYLERIHTIARKLDTLINQPETLYQTISDEEYERATGVKAPKKSTRGNVFDKSQLSTFNSLLRRFLTMCAENNIRFKKEVEGTEKPEPAAKSKPATDPKSPPAVATPTPTPAPTPEPVPAPTPTPAPSYRKAEFEDYLVMPDVVPPHIEKNNNFNQWLAEIQPLFNEKGYDAAAIRGISLEGLYTFYQEIQPVLDKTREYILNGKLDKALGLVTKNLDESASYDLRENVFLKLQYSLFENRNKHKPRLEQIIKSIETTEEADKEIKTLEARLQARARIIGLGKRDRVTVQDAITVNEQDHRQFTRDNIAAVEDFITDMKNNYLFYAGAAKTLKADGARDDIYDRYKATHGDTPSKVEKVGVFGRLKAKVKAKLGKLNMFRDMTFGRPMSDRHEGINQFWNMMRKLEESQLLPVQQNGRFREGAIVQSNEKIDLLLRYINETFNGARPMLGGVELAKAQKIFEGLYNVYVENVTQSMNYQKKARDFAKQDIKAVPESEIQEDIELIQKGIQSHEDWVTRALGHDNPELIQETKEEMVLIHAKAFERALAGMKFDGSENLDVVRANITKFDQMFKDWNNILVGTTTRRAVVANEVTRVQKIFTEKYAKIELLRVKKGVESDSMIQEVVDRYINTVKGTPETVLSAAEKRRLGEQLVREIETRLASGTFTTTQRYRLNGAVKRVQRDLVTA